MSKYDYEKIKCLEEALEAAKDESDRLRRCLTIAKADNDKLEAQVRSLTESIEVIRQLANHYPQDKAILKYCDKALSSSLEVES